MQGREEIFDFYKNIVLTIHTGTQNTLFRDTKNNNK